MKNTFLHHHVSYRHDWKFLNNYILHRRYIDQIHHMNKCLHYKCILHHNYSHYGPYAGLFKGRPSGVLIAQDPGTTNTYGLFYLQERGALFLRPTIPIYGGQIVGLHARNNDLIVNPSKSKKLTNIRTTSADEKLFLTPPIELTLEAALELINEDELVEVTPRAIRVRKRHLAEHERRRATRGAAQDAGVEALVR